MQAKGRAAWGSGSGWNDRRGYQECYLVPSVGAYAHACMRMISIQAILADRRQGGLCD